MIELIERIMEMADAFQKKYELVPNTIVICEEDFKIMEDTIDEDLYTRLNKRSLTMSSRDRAMSVPLAGMAICYNPHIDRTAVGVTLSSLLDEEDTDHRKMLDEHVQETLNE